MDEFGVFHLAMSPAFWPIVEQVANLTWSYITVAINFLPYLLIFQWIMRIRDFLLDFVYDIKYKFSDMWKSWFKTFWLNTSWWYKKSQSLYKISYYDKAWFYGESMTNYNIKHFRKLRDEELKKSQIKTDKTLTSIISNL